MKLARNALYYIPHGMPEPLDFVPMENRQLNSFKGELLLRQNQSPFGSTRVQAGWRRNLSSWGPRGERTTPTPLTLNTRVSWTQDA